MLVGDHADHRLQQRCRHLERQCDRSDLEKAEMAIAFEQRVDRDDHRLHHVVQHVHEADRAQHAVMRGTLPLAGSHVRLRAGRRRRATRVWSGHVQVHVRGEGCANRVGNAAVTDVRWPHALFQPPRALSSRTGAATGKSTFHSAAIRDFRNACAAVSGLPSHVSRCTDAPALPDACTNKPAIVCAAGSVNTKTRLPWQSADWQTCESHMVLPSTRTRTDGADALLRTHSGSEAAPCIVANAFAKLGLRRITSSDGAPAGALSGAAVDMPPAGALIGIADVAGAGLDSGAEAVGAGVP